jgi:RES domain
MRRKRRAQPPEGRSRGGAQGPDLPSLLELERFSEASLHQWRARRLGLRQAPWLIRSPITLQRQLLHPNWRMLPVQFDLPSNSQIFGRLASAAGLHGILYPSVRQQGKGCLALFTQNWANSGSNIQVSDGVPEGARLTRVDGDRNI